MEPGPNFAFYQYLKGAEFRKSMVDWAVSVVANGGGGKHTILLAGADNEEERVVADWFRLAALENGITLPGEDARLIWIERFLCKQIIDRSVPPTEALGALYQLWLDDGYSDRFKRWCDLAYNVEYLEEGHGSYEPFPDMTMQTIDETIVREAVAVVESGRESLGG